MTKLVGRSGIVECHAAMQCAKKKTETIPETAARHGGTGNGPVFSDRYDVARTSRVAVVHPVRVVEPFIDRSLPVRPRDASLLAPDAQSLVLGDQP